MVDSSIPTQQPFSEFTYRSRITQDLKVLPGDNAKSLEEARKQAPTIIGTHSEVFHCDEILAITMLLYTSEFEKSAIVRTRNQEILDQLDIVCDVGAVFDVSKKRFDHHQRTFNMAWHEDENLPIDETLAEQPFKIKLSSAGLVYKYYGREVLKRILSEAFGESSSVFTQADHEKIYQKLYKNFFQEIDAKDNGVSVTKGEERYWVNTHLGTRVSRYNKAWNAPASVDQNQQFKRAMTVAEEELYWQIYSIAQVLMPARKQVEEAWAKREQFNATGEFMFIENSCPWKDHLYNIEAEQNKEGLIKFVFFKDPRGMHRIQAVPPKGSGFDMRVPLSKAWRGLRAEELKKCTEFQDMEFVHHSGFIGGAWSFETAIAMAEISLKEHAETIQQRQEAISTEMK